MPRASIRCCRCLQGGALAGARTYTATCGPGLAFMFEPYFRTSGMRLPIVMSIVTRDGITPQSVWGGHQDAMTVREVGWVQVYCETVQEVLDTTIMAFKIAEHHDVMLPVNVCLDGNYLSYGTSRVELPGQAEVDAFMGVKDVNWHVALDPHAADGGRSADRRHQRQGTVDLRALSQGPVPRHAELLARDRGNPRGVGATLRPPLRAAGRGIPDGRRRLRDHDPGQHDRARPRTRSTRPATRARTWA